VFLSAALCHAKHLKSFPFVIARPVGRNDEWRDFCGMLSPVAHSPALPDQVANSGFRDGHFGVSFGGQVLQIILIEQPDKTRTVRSSLACVRRNASAGRQA
jgi:hypothetical protein